MRTTQIIRLLAVWAALAGCQHDEATSDAAGVLPKDAPYYRFWRGHRRPDLDQAAFLAKLGGTFIPGTPKAMAPLGLAGYLVTLPPATHPSVIADELALVAYPSEAAYKAAMATPAGQAYGQLHWTVFDKNTSLSLVPADGMPKLLQDNHAYDLVHKPVDWRNQYALTFIGTRRANVSQDEFLRRLTHHVGQAQALFLQHGVNGYVILATEDYELAFLAWPSKAAMDGALATAEGQAIVADAGTFMDTLLWAPAGDFSGTATPGAAYNWR